jgi:AraC-like DNA-binding protein
MLVLLFSLPAAHADIWAILVGMLPVGQLSENTGQVFTASHSNKPPVLRMGHVMAFTGYLHEHGTYQDAYLARHGLPLLCDNPDHFVPLRRVWAFLDAAANDLDPMLGWAVGKHVGDHNINNAILSQIENAPSLLAAIQRLQNHLRMEASDLEVGIYARHDDVLLYTHYTGLRDSPGHSQSQAYQLGIFISLARHFLGREWAPEQIGVESAEPPGEIRNYFPCRQVATRQPVGFITIPRNQLCQQVPCRGKDAKPVDTLVSTDKLGFVGTLRELLGSYLPDGYPTACFAAKLMDVSERTLARRLSAAGYTYGALVDELRFEESKRLLRESGGDIADTAHAVGFDDQGNFTRLFRRLGGLTPSEFCRNSTSQ